MIELEREITLFHSKIVNEVSLKYKDEVNFVGFHGQTIFHNPELKISRQLGDGELMSQLIKKHVVYDFRQEDLKIMVRVHLWHLFFIIYYPKN